MGYTNYATLAPVNRKTWAAYVGALRRMYDHLVSTRGLRLTSTDLHDLHGNTGDRSPPTFTSTKVLFNSCDADMQCEFFSLHRMDLQASAQMFCKTSRGDYDFAVKCALVLLTEFGGATKLSSDCDDLDEWAEVVTFLGDVPGLPVKYPKASHVIVSQFKGADSQAAYMRIALAWGDVGTVAWILNKENPCSDCQALRRAALKVLHALRKPMIARRNVAWLRYSVQLGMDKYLDGRIAQCIVDAFIRTT